MKSEIQPVALGTFDKTTFVSTVAQARAKKASAARWTKYKGDPRGHPSTSEMDYSADESEFLSAVSRWKSATGRVFPTLCELMGVMKELGYAKSSARPSP